MAHTVQYSVCMWFYSDDGTQGNTYYCTIGSTRRAISLENSSVDYIVYMYTV